MRSSDETGDDEPRKESPEPARTLPLNAQILEGYAVSAQIDEEGYEFYRRIVATLTKNCIHYQDAA